jgi:CheY-like chemotaxis protein
MTILLVDDSPVARRVLARRLAAEGFDVREEGSFGAGRKVEPGPLSCAVIDLELGDGDGTDLAAALLGRRPSLPVAFFSAGAAPSLVESARARGPVFHKPDVEPLVAWVKRFARVGRDSQGPAPPSSRWPEGYPPPTK